MSFTLIGSGFLWSDDAIEIVKKIQIFKLSSTLTSQYTENISKKKIP